MHPWNHPPPPPPPPRRRPPHQRQEGERPQHRPQSDGPIQQRPLPPPRPPGRFPLRPPVPPPPPFATHVPGGANMARPPATLHMVNGPLTGLPADEQMAFEKMVETHRRNPELVDMVKQSQRGNPKYHFLYEESSLHSYFQWRIRQPERQQPHSVDGPKENANNTRPMLQQFRPPPPLPPPEAIAIMRRAVDPSPAQQPHLLYHKLPAGLMVKLIDEGHTPYSALRSSDLESAEFLESVAPGLSLQLPFTDANAPALTSDIEQALAHFDRGLCYIYKEGEFEDRGNPFADAGTHSSRPMDKEGWNPGALEKVLWDRRKGSEERRKWKHAQDRAQLRQAGEDVSSSSQSSDESSSSDDSSSSSSSSTSPEERTGKSPNARGSSINTAIGSDNVGFRLLSKLGWHQGQGLGASNDGIVEPIRPQTRFSTIRHDKGGSHRARRQRTRGGRKKNVEMRASIGTGRREDAGMALAAGSDDAARSNAEFDVYRKHMSSTYNSGARQNLDE